MKADEEEKQEETCLIFLRDSKYLRVTRETIFLQDKNDANICVTKTTKPFGILFAVPLLGKGRNYSGKNRKSREPRLVPSFITGLLW